MRHHRCGAALVVDVDRVERRPVHGAVQEHDGPAFREIRAQRRPVDARRHDDEPVHAASHRPERRLGLGPVAVGARHEKLVSGSARRAIDAADRLGEELAEEIRQENADRVRPPRDETPGAAVGDVAQPVGGRADAAARDVAHRPLAVENAGDGRDRNAGGPCDLADGRAGGTIPPTALPGSRAPGLGGDPRVSHRADVNVYILLKRG